MISGILDNVLMELGTQNITMRITGLRNIDYVTDIGVAMIRTFYDS